MEIPLASSSGRHPAKSRLEGCDSSSRQSAGGGPVSGTPPLAGEGLGERSGLRAANIRNRTDWRARQGLHLQRDCLVFARPTWSARTARNERKHRFCQGSLLPSSEAPALVDGSMAIQEIAWRRIGRAEEDWRRLAQPGPRAAARAPRRRMRRQSAGNRARTEEGDGCGVASPPL
jgi:hypothetical protein